jgi:hypothetical protein
VAPWSSERELEGGSPKLAKVGGIQASSAWASAPETWSFTLLGMERPEK